MSDYVRTYVTSSTYDTLKNVMYPDVTEVERPVEDVERLILQGHTVEYRFGDSRSVILDIDKFNTFVKPYYPTADEILRREAAITGTEEVAPLSINESLTLDTSEAKLMTPEPDVVNKAFTLIDGTKNPVEQLLEQGATKEEIVALGFNPSEVSTVTNTNTEAISGNTVEPLVQNLDLSAFGVPASNISTESAYSPSVNTIKQPAEEPKKETKVEETVNTEVPVEESVKEETPTEEVSKETESTEGSVEGESTKKTTTKKKGGNK